MHLRGIGGEGERKKTKIKENTLGLCFIALTFPSMFIWEKNVSALWNNNC